jgi:hypothetical protein
VLAERHAGADGGSMHGDSQAKNARVITDIDPNELSRSPLVKTFMLRVIDSLRHPLTGAVFVVVLADRAADAFDLYLADGALPEVLLDLAMNVIATDSQRRPVSYPADARPALTRRASRQSEER